VRHRAQARRNRSEQGMGMAVDLGDVLKTEGRWPKLASEGKIKDQKTLQKLA